MKKLIIVESPAKCKKINSFVGSNYIVKASFGHIRDLDKGLGAIDIAHEFKPKYKNIPSKSKVIRELKKIASNCSEVIIASDLDREGEAIGYHVAKILRLNLDTTKRIIFNQITKKAVLKALNNPTRIDMNLFYSQQARRILDRLVGFELSPLLWKFVKLNLSAGRCQSPAVRLVYDREQEIQNFASQLYFEISFQGQVTKRKKYSLQGLFVTKYNDIKLVKQLLSDCKKALFTIKKIQQKISQQRPPPPFTTSSLQQDASSKLGMSPKICMMVAQKLYEAGKITYMRTDSVDLSKEALDLIKKQIIDKYGKEHYELRKYKTKTKGSQEAHEAIRPVYPNTENITGFSQKEQKLYNLIYKRTIASQMKSCKKRIWTIQLMMDNRKDLIKCQIEHIIYLGYLLVYNGELSKKDPILETLEIGDKVNYQEIIATQKYSKAKGHYTEASLIKELEKKGIGRPSTFSNLISTIQTREYVIKDTRPGKQTNIQILTLKKNKLSKETKEITIGAEKNKLFLTDTGKMVIEFLLKNFQQLMNYDFTSQVETKLDQIANGNCKWNLTVQDVYNLFHPTVLKLKKEKNNKQKNHRKIGLIDNQPVIAFVGNYGPCIQIGNNENKKLNKYLKIPKEFTIDTITIKDIQQWKKYPITICVYKNYPILIKKGPYGLYMNYNTQNISLKDLTEDSIKEFTKKKAIELLKKSKKKSNKRN